MISMSISPIFKCPVFVHSASMTGDLTTLNTREMDRLELVLRIAERRLAQTGMRIGEACGRRWRDCDREMQGRADVGDVPIAQTLGTTDARGLRGSGLTSRENASEPTLESTISGDAPAAVHRRGHLRRTLSRGTQDQEILRVRIPIADRSASPCLASVPPHTRGHCPNRVFAAWVHTGRERISMSKGQKRTATTNKPKLTQKEKKAKKVEKAAKKAGKEGLGILT